MHFTEYSVSYSYIVSHILSFIKPHSYEKLCLLMLQHTLLHTNKRYELSNDSTVISPQSCILCY